MARARARACIILIISAQRAAGQERGRSRASGGVLHRHYKRNACTRRQACGVGRHPRRAGAPRPALRPSSGSRLAARSDSSAAAMQHLRLHSAPRRAHTRASRVVVAASLPDLLCARACAQPGETISSIASKYNVAVRDLKVRACCSATASARGRCSGSQAEVHPPWRCPSPAPLRCSTSRSRRSSRATRCSRARRCASPRGAPRPDAACRAVAVHQRRAPLAQDCTSRKTATLAQHGRRKLQAAESQNAAAPAGALAPSWVLPLAGVGLLAWGAWRALQQQGQQVRQQWQASSSPSICARGRFALC